MTCSEEDQDCVRTYRRAGQRCSHAPLASALAARRVGACKRSAASDRRLGAPDPREAGHRQAHPGRRPRCIRPGRLEPVLPVSLPRHTSADESAAAHVTSLDPDAQVAALLLELGNYSEALLDKPRLLAFTKMDLLPEGTPVPTLGDSGEPVMAISAQIGRGVEALLWALDKELVRLDQLPDSTSKVGFGAERR